MLATSLFSSSSSGSIRGSPLRRRVFVGHRRGGRGPGLAKDPKEAPGPRLDGVGVHSDSNGYGSDIEEGVCSERRRGAEKPHHGLQVDITTSRPKGCFHQPSHVLYSKLANSWGYFCINMFKICVVTRFRHQWCKRCRLFLRIQQI